MQQPKATGGGGPNSNKPHYVPNDLFDAKSRIDKNRTSDLLPKG